MTTVEPVSVEQARLHLRLDEDDERIVTLPDDIAKARHGVERYLNASLVYQQRTLKLPGFPAQGAICLPNGPVRSIDSINYIDSAGDPQTLTSFTLDDDKLYPAYEESWPDHRSHPGYLTIVYNAGLMTAPAAGDPSVLVEADLAAAVLLIIGDLFENGQGQVVGTIISTNLTLQRLLDPHRREMGL